MWRNTGAHDAGTHFSTREKNFENGTQSFNRGEKIGHHTEKLPSQPNHYSLTFSWHECQEKMAMDIFVEYSNLFHNFGM